MPSTTERSPAAHRVIPWIVTAPVVMVLIGLSAVLWLARRDLPSSESESSLPFYGRVAEFALTDRSGRLLTRRDLEGHIWVADFMFTNCPGQCPRMTMEMSRLQSRLAEEVRFVSFTVDPERDTPEVLSDYAATYGALEDRWFFLTGGREALNRLASSFRMSAVDDPNSHSIRLVLVDGKGDIRGYYNPIDPESVNRLVAHAQLLLSGAKS